MALYLEFVIRQDAQQGDFSRARVGRKLIQDIRIKQLTFLGHVVWKDDLESVWLAGKIGT